MLTFCLFVSLLLFENCFLKNFNLVAEIQAMSLMALWMVCNHTIANEMGPLNKEVIK